MDDSRYNLNEIDNSRLTFLDNMRSIAIIMVVGVHALGYSIQLPEVLEQIIKIIVHSISVPVFFLADGYLFSLRINQSIKFNYIESIKKSFARLIVPWIIFNFLYTLARYVFELKGLLDNKLIVGQSFSDVLISSYGSVYASHMYFLMSLFLIRLCAPIIAKVINIKKILYILIVFMIYVVIYHVWFGYFSAYLHIEGGQEPVLHALWGFQYYLLGIILFKLRELIDVKKIFLPFLGMLFFALYNINNANVLISIIFQYSYLILFFVLFYCFISKDFINIVGRNTMGIYLIHSPIIIKLVSTFVNKYFSVPIVNYILIFSISFVMSLCIVLLIRWIPNGKCLFGEFSLVSTSKSLKKEMVL